MTSGDYYRFKAEEARQAGGAASPRPSIGSSEDGRAVPLRDLRKASPRLYPPGPASKGQQSSDGFISKSPRGKSQERKDSPLREHMREPLNANDARWTSDNASRPVSVVSAISHVEIRTVTAPTRPARAARPAVSKKASNRSLKNKQQDDGAAQSKIPRSPKTLKKKASATSIKSRKKQDEDGASLPPVSPASPLDAQRVYQRDALTTPPARPLPRPLAPPNSGPPTEPMPQPPQATARQSKHKPVKSVVSIGSAPDSEFNEDDDDLLDSIINAHSSHDEVFDEPDSPPFGASSMSNQSNTTLSSKHRSSAKDVPIEEMPRDSHIPDFDEEDGQALYKALAGDRTSIGSDVWSNPSAGSHGDEDEDEKVLMDIKTPAEMAAASIRVSDGPDRNMLTRSPTQPQTPTTGRTIDSVMRSPTSQQVTSPKSSGFSSQSFLNASERINANVLPESIKHLGESCPSSSKPLIPC